jgi:hypothetical protein
MPAKHDGLADGYALLSGLSRARAEAQRVERQLVVTVTRAAIEA